MEQFQGSERLILQIIVDSPKDSAGYVEDTRIAKTSNISIQDVQKWLETLEGKGFVERAGIIGGFSAHVTAKGELALRHTSTDQVTRVSDSSQTPIKVVPKGLRSYEEEDAYFFLELLPGTRDRDGLPESIRYWKIPIERTDADRTFRVGLIYGPSGSGKSSLVKAGLLPRLAEHVLSIHIEVTADGTEARLLNSLHKRCPELPTDLGFAESISSLSEGRGLSHGRKVLIVLDQFEQWLSTWRGEEDTGLITALRQCDGGHVQAIVLVRDDFWMAVNRFEKQLGVEFRRTLNSYGIDLFDPIHAKKVLMDFGRGFGQLRDDQKDLSYHQKAFLEQAVEGLVEKGKVVPIRLSLFAWMVQGKPWTPASLKEVGGAEGVGVNFLEETFSSPNAEPKCRLHQKAAQAVLKALLPQDSTKIRGDARSHSELLSASGYAHRPKDFDELCQLMDMEVRLITPTAREESSTTDQKELTKPIEQYYQLTHDYLVPSIREWLTRKQKETRRGRAELLLAERSSLWNAKPENRHLPSALEWANIRLLTKRWDWTQPQRKMMKRAGWVHESRLAALVLLALLAWGGIEVYRPLRASFLVDQLRDAETTQVPALVRQLDGYRRWANPRLKELVQSADDDSRVKLHGSLALLPVDPSQLPFLEKRLLVASPTDLGVIRAALWPHRETLIPKLWSVLDAAQPGNVSLLPTASALADYDATSNRWESLRGKVVQALVSLNPIQLGPWLEVLRPVRGKLNVPLGEIFRDKNRPESVHSLATDILTEYASDDPNLVANLLMDAQPKAYASLFPIAQRLETKTLPLFQDEIAKRPEYSWNDPPLDLSWTKPDAILTAKIESAQGMLAERFAFCQTMPLDEFLTIAEALRKSGYRPVRFRPYAEGKSLGVAAVWTRDGRPWRLAHDQSTDEIRQTDERNRKEGYLSVDVAGYLAASGDEGKPTSRFTALWALRTRPDDDARMVLASSAAELTKVQEQLKDAGLVPLTLHAWRQADDKLSYSGVWHKTATGTSDTASLQNGLSEAVLPGVLAQQAGSLIDLDLTAAPPPPSTKERAASALQVAEAALKAKPDDLNARLARASAYFQLGENMKAIDDFNAVIEKAPALVAYQFRAIAHARQGHKDQARADQERFQKGDSTESTRLYLAVVVAAELGEGTDQAFEKLDAALQKQPQDAGLHYDAARAYALAFQAVARKDQARGKSLSERALSLLRKAFENGYANYKHMQEDVDLDSLRNLPAFADIMKPGHLDRSYAAVWRGDFRFEASPIFGLDPTAHLQRCRELASQDYHMVSLSVAQISSDTPPITASVWHRPVITEETRDRLAERQARAAIALLRMGQVEEVIPRLRHSADPRLRSFIVNWLNPLGADPKAIVAALDRIDPSIKPTPAEPPKAMDAILFHPETSMRRALILALGTYGREGLSSGEREPLTGKLLDLYRNDPDAGIHGAVEWTLRQWKQDEKLRNLDAELSKLKDRGNRRWYVNSQGQTFAVIEGPVEFRMGSPPTEPERFSDEILHRRRIIPRRFAIATQEVTVEQYQRFVKTNPQFGLDPSDLARYSPKGTEPMIAVSWYGAAAYCNWLSEQEGLLKDKWCYLPNRDGAYDAGMSIPADVLKRTGYRLPTEAEWEYACRSGTITSRYYGVSTDLLGKYSWYQANSREHAWPGGSLIPNESGLFDMLGNVTEWCQDRALTVRYQPGGTAMIIDNINELEYVNINNHRVLRCGSFLFQPANVRSAFRFGKPPSYRNVNYGFRPSRTYH
jgi:formylglycine-generating enzyme required for sulfatase activity/predicted transcriptional regulator